MGQVIIRNLDDSVLLRLKQMAQRDSKSLEQFLRDQLSETAMRDREGFFEFARGMRERCKPIDIDPTDLIREDRDR
jgi:plasmid stability protein